MISAKILDQFKAIVGSENVQKDQASLLAYSYDSTPQLQQMPGVVISPRNTKEVSEVVKICHKERLPIIPRGSGTNLCGGTVPVENSVVILFNPVALHELFKQKSSDIYLSQYYEQW